MSHGEGGERRPSFATHVVAGADGNLVEVVEHVELGQGDGVETVQHHRRAQHREIEPSGPPRAAGDGAVFVAALAKMLANVVIELGGERAAAHPRGVGLGHAEDAADVFRSNTQAGCHPTHDAVRGSDEGIGSVIDVEHRSLRPLEHHSLALADLLVDPHRAVGDSIRQHLPEANGVVVDRLRIERLLSVDGLQHRILFRAREFDLLAQHRAIQQVGHANAIAADLRLVRGPDAAPGCADLRRPGRLFASQVECTVIRKNDVGRVADLEVVADPHAELAKVVDFFQ